MNSRNSSGILKKSGNLNKLLLLTFIFSGCAIIKRTPKSYTKKNLTEILSGNHFLPESFSLKYRVNSKGLSLAGKAFIQNEDSFIKLTTNTLFTGKVSLKINIKNTGYTLLDFTGMYLFGKNPLHSFSFAGIKDKDILLFTRNSDSLEVSLRNNLITFIRQKQDNILLFYSKDGNLQYLKGELQGINFEGRVIK